MKTRIFEAAQMTRQDKEELSRALSAGAVAVLPTDTVYGLGTGGNRERGIQTIYRLKNRPATSPLPLLSGGTEQVHPWAQFSPQAERLAARFWPGALTLILPPTEDGLVLARGFTGLGFRVPGYAFLVELLQGMSVPMACTSANLHGQPVITDEHILVETFNGQVDYIVRAGTLSPVASSVVDLTAQPRLLREGALTRTVLENVLDCPFAN